MRVAPVPLELVDEHKGVHGAVLHRMRFHVRKRRGPVGVGDGRYRRGWLRAGRGRGETRHDTCTPNDKDGEAPHTSTRTSLNMPAAMW
jgi:hypothetical protein